MIRHHLGNVKVASSLKRLSCHLHCNVHTSQQTKEIKSQNAVVPSSEQVRIKYGAINIVILPLQHIVTLCQRCHPLSLRAFLIFSYIFLSMFFFSCLRSLIFNKVQKKLLSLVSTNTCLEVIWYKSLHSWFRHLCHFCQKRS